MFAQGLAFILVNGLFFGSQQCVVSTSVDGRRSFPFHCEVRGLCLILLTRYLFLTRENFLYSLPI
jgi:hypothetical protein